MFGKTREYNEALENKLKSLEIALLLFDPMDSRIGTACNNVGSTLDSLERHEEALEYKQKALKIHVHVFGKIILRQLASITILDSH